MGGYSLNIMALNLVSDLVVSIGGQRTCCSDVIIHITVKLIILSSSYTFNLDSEKLRSKP